MSNVITQTFGIDASQALAALKQLDTGFADFQKRLDSVAAKIQSFNKGGGITTAADQISAGMQAARVETERLTTSFGLLNRIVFTQFVVSAFSEVKQSIEAAAESAIEFQKQLALISTIDQSGRSIAALGADVRSLSDAFNIPLLEAAKGLYQTLSNQVGDTATSLRFLAEASSFAKATGSELADSVDLLSGVLKSYRLEADDVNRVSSILFKTIDLGRVNAAELANSFGRLGPLAKDAGLSLEETSAALAAISIRGSKTSESITQLRSILAGLVKPSDAMAKSLRELGFTSSGAALRTLGLPGALDALGKSAGGSNEQLARLFPNIRGLSGVSSLLGDDLKSLSDNIRLMETAGRDFNKQKFLQATATDAEKATDVVNRFKNLLIVDLGQAALSATANLIDFAGGGERVIEMVKGAQPAFRSTASCVIPRDFSTWCAIRHIMHHEKTRQFTA